MPVGAGLIAGAVSGLISGISGISQRHKGRKLLRQLGESPIEEMPAEVLQNQQLAQTRAKTGLPSEQYQQAMQNIQRQQMQALRGANDRRGGLALLSSLNQGANDATLGLDVANSKQRIQNESQLMTVNNQVAGWKSRLFDTNVRNPYNQKYSYAQSLIGAGNQNLTGGLDKISAAGSLYGYQGGFNRRKLMTNSFEDIPHTEIRTSHGG